MICLPLMIFGCLHSRDSQLHNSFCSKNIILKSKIPPFVWRVMFRNPQARAVTTWHTKITNSIRKVRRNMSNDFYNQSSGCFYNTESIIFQLDCTFFNRREREYVCSKLLRMQNAAGTQPSGFSPAISVILYSQTIF